MFSDHFGMLKHASGYVTVRNGAHMFYWLFYTTAEVENYTHRPLVVWLQGGPGGSSTGQGNFETIGPLDLSLHERSTTWVKNFNVLFVDSPVGAGFSYVDEFKFLTTNNDEIVNKTSFLEGEWYKNIISAARDLVQLMRGFYNHHLEFNGVPLYICGQSYGGKMAIDMGIRMHEAEQTGTIGSNLKGIALVNAWISPVDAILTWGPLLLAAGLVEKAGHDEIQAAAREAERLFNEGLYHDAAIKWAKTQGIVLRCTYNVDFYNILTKRVSCAHPVRVAEYEFTREMMIWNFVPISLSEARQTHDNLDTLMNTRVKQFLHIPARVTWGSLCYSVFDNLKGDFMIPVTDGIEKLLNETDIIVTIFNGNLDLMCTTPGQLLWVDRLKWPGAEGYKNAQRHPIWENDKLEGYYKSYGNFRFFWINDAGHNVPNENPAGTNAVLLNMTETDMPALINSITVKLLVGEGIGDLNYTAAFTQIPAVGDIFWWFYPTIEVGNPHDRPLILWLDGVTGVPPSLLANLGMFGPYDINFKRRQNSWINRYNLLFIDAPLGTGFSTPLTNNQIPKTVDENAEHLALTLESFYTVHEAYRNTSLYIFGQAYGAQLALALAAKLHQNQNKTNNLRGVVLGNGIISPALAMTKLGFYLEELGYIDSNGRDAIETLSGETTQLVQEKYLEKAFDKFISLGQFVNDNAGAVAVNLVNIVEKLTREPSLEDIFGQREYLRSVFKITDFDIMNSKVAPALGIPSTVTYDSGREAVIEAFRKSYMTPATDKVEYILQNTELTVAIYNGNLDAVSNTPGQLEWVENLEWSGQSDFLVAPRQSLVVDEFVEGYFRNGMRLQFFWVNAAGQWAPLENPAALTSILNRVVV